MRREHPDHFITRLANFSFGNCKRAYYFHKAGLTLTKVGRLVDPDLGSYKPPAVKEMIKAFGEALAYEAEVEQHRLELIKNKVPYYERSFDSWENEIITRVTGGSNGNWYAVLDSRGYKFGSLDFATCCDSRQDAIRMCALRLRLDVIGIGKFAPHSTLQGYERTWEMAKFWAKKETQRNYRQSKRVTA